MEKLQSILLLIGEKGSNIVWNVCVGYIYVCVCVFSYV